MATNFIFHGIFVLDSVYFQFLTLKKRKKKEKEKDSYFLVP